MQLPEFNARNILYIAFFTSLISAVTMVFLLINYKKPSPPTSLKEKIAKLETEETAPVEKKNYINILLMGYGGVGHPGGGLADANVLVNVNIDKKQVSFIAIPRDTWVDSGIGNAKINTAYAIGNDDEGYPNKPKEFTGRHGGGKMAMAAAEKITGLKINYYAAIDFDRFIRAIDALQGINVNVPIAFTDEYFPIPGEETNFCGESNQFIEEAHEKYSGFQLESQFKCRYETLSFKKGNQKMDGSTALKFIRSRHSTTQGSDFARGVRAQAVLTAIKNKLFSLDAINNVDEFYEEYRQMVTTNIGRNDIAEELAKIGIVNAGDYEYQNLNITNENYLQTSRSNDGQEILIPKAGLDNFSEIKNYIISNI